MHGGSPAPNGPMIAVFLASDLDNPRKVRGRIEGPAAHGRRSQGNAQAGSIRRRFFVGQRYLLFVKQNRRYQIGNLLRAVSAVLGSDLAQPADDVCLHLLKRPKRLVQTALCSWPLGAGESARGQTRAAKGSVWRCSQTLAMMLVVPGTTGEGLRQATHHVTGAFGRTYPARKQIAGSYHVPAGGHCA